MARILHLLAGSGADVQTIVQNTAVQHTAGPGSRRSDVAMIVPAAHAVPALAVLDAAKGTIGFEDLQYDSRVGRVSITGLGMRSSPEIFCTFLKALSDADVDLDLVDISETCMGAVTHADRLADAERAVRQAFGMAPADEDACRESLATSRPLAASRRHMGCDIGHDMTTVPRDRTVARHF